MKDHPAILSNNFAFGFQHKKTRYAAIELVQEEIKYWDSQFIDDHTIVSVTDRLNKLIKNIQNLPQ